MARAVDVRITGRVQGVFFRAHAAREAERLDVSGWIRNEPDGSVTAHLEGAEEAVTKLVEWCEQGSPAARVTRVDVSDVSVRGLATFEVDS